MDFRWMRSNNTSNHLITGFSNMAVIQDVSHISRWKSWFLEQLSLQGMPQHLFQFALFVRLDTETLDYWTGSCSFLFLFEVSCSCHVTHLWKWEYCFLLFLSGCHTNLRAGKCLFKLSNAWYCLFSSLIFESIFCVCVFFLFRARACLFAFADHSFLFRACLLCTSPILPLLTTPFPLNVYPL